MAVNYVIGDLLESDEQVIAHGCNTQGVMGAGIAAAVAAKYPEVERAYRVACRAKDFRVGSCQDVYLAPESRLVFNLGTQRYPGKDATYWAIMLAFGNMFEYCKVMNIKRVGIPRIGCGIAGLEWPTVEWVINGIINDWVNDAPEVVVYTLAREAHKWNV